MFRVYARYACVVRNLLMSGLYIEESQDQI